MTIPAVYHPLMYRLLLEGFKDFRAYPAPEIHKDHFVLTGRNLQGMQVSTLLPESGILENRDGSPMQRPMVYVFNLWMQYKDTIPNGNAHA